MSTGSSPSDEFMTVFKRQELILAHLIFDVHGHNLATRNRLHSAANFVLQYAFDNPHNDALDLVDETEAYLDFGGHMRRNFMGAKIMPLNMIFLEDLIMVTYPDGDNGEHSNEALSSIIEHQLRAQEICYLEERIPIYPEGTGLSDEMISPFLKNKACSPKPENSTNDSVNCCICWDPLIDSGGNVAGSYYCEHMFHVKCIVRWLYDHRLCPVCRNLVLPPDVEYPHWLKDLSLLRDFLDRDY